MADPKVANGSEYAICDHHYDPLGGCDGTYDESGACGTCGRPSIKACGHLWGEHGKTLTATEAFDYRVCLMCGKKEHKRQSASWERDS